MFLQNWRLQFGYNLFFFVYLPSQTQQVVKFIMKQTISSIVFLLFSLCTFSSTINFRFATKVEGQLLKTADTAYFNKFSQSDLDWRMCKENSSLDEYIAYCSEQVQDFTSDEQQIISKAISTIEDSLKALGCQLPIPDDIVFIKTTMKEEGGAAAYTIKNQIYIGSEFIKYGNGENPRASVFFTSIVAHELFHCISRYSPSFRQQMYALIGFTVMDEEIDFPESVRKRIITNPDVERYDSYGTFTINGQPRRCALMSLYTKTWKEAYAEQKDQATFFNNIDAVLIPLDDLSTSYSLKQCDVVSDFWTQVGENTAYVIAPEECMADNFSFAIIPSMPRNEYKSAWLIQGIINPLGKN